MTLGEFIGYLGNNPVYAFVIFFLLPFAAFLGNIMAKGEGEESPWCIYYSALIYLTVIPGIFAILLNIYHVLIEKGSLYEMNLMVQILPIVSMIVTLVLIKKNVAFHKIPGFGSMTTFLSTMTGLMVLFYIVEKSHLIVFSYLPFHWLIIMLVVLFLVIRYGTKLVFK